jgi:glycosyltransferase involved in cell wall biosynthesis
MNGDLCVLVTDGNRAAESRSWSGSEWRSEPPVNQSAARELARLADGRTRWVAWFDRRIESRLSDITSWPALLKHDLEVLHAGWLDRPDRAVASLAYVDFDSLYFFPPATDRRAPMWFVSSAAGIASASALRAVGIDLIYSEFAASLIDFGARGMRIGLCPFSEPSLATPPARSEDPATRARVAPSQVALLARRLYGRQWLLFWLASTLFFSRSLHLWSAVRAWLQPSSSDLDEGTLAKVAPAPETANASATVHAVVPTLGRPQSVEQLLEDLAAQTHPPRSVALIEQQPGGGQSALTQLTTRTWPFEVAHELVSWTGACRARNEGVDLAKADWVLYLDDDVRVPAGFIEHAVSVARTYGAQAVCALVRSPGGPSQPEIGRPHFTSRFPSGASLVSLEACRTVGPFDLRLEGGWGEDFDYGIRLRKAGFTMLRTPGEPILHLHEASGGFRSPLPHPWDHDNVAPRPAPTVLLSRRGLPVEMQQGYRRYYVLKRLAGVPWYRAISEWTVTRRQWRAAIQWANRLQPNPTTHMQRTAS